jgi:hypothetical protein
MKNFAVIDKDNIVTNVIVADTLEIAESVTSATCIEYSDINPAEISDIYDPVLNIFITPTTEEIVTE